MSVPASEDIFAFQRRGTDVRVDIDSDAEPGGPVLDITFRAVNGDIEIGDLTATSGGSGLLVDFTLTDNIWTCGRGHIDGSLSRQYRRPCMLSLMAG